MILFWLSVCSFVLVVTVVGKVVLSHRYIVDISSRTVGKREWPKVSIIVSARNEQDSIESAILTLLKLDYPALELVVVNDRSTDQTLPILERVQRTHPALRIATLHELPSGWLGKCNAMHQGAKLASGDWLLFTDADVSMDPDTLRYALDYVMAEQADHLTLAPKCELPSWLLCSFVATFALFFKMLVNPAQIPNPRSGAHVGIGAFNLIRRDVYASIGGHERIRMRPDDDLKLGKLVKLAGFSQRFADGTRLISVPWYRSFSELMRGLEKNSFAGFEYQIPRWIASNLLIAFLFLFPFIALGFAHGSTWGILFASCVLLIALGVFNAMRSGYQFHHGLLFPIMVFLFLLVLDRAVCLTLWRQGINWRGQFYALDDLIKNS